MPFSRSSPSRDQTGVSCIAGGFFTSWAIRGAQLNISNPFPEINGLSTIIFHPALPPITPSILLESSIQLISLFSKTLWNLARCCAYNFPLSKMSSSLFSSHLTSATLPSPICTSPFPWDHFWSSQLEVVSPALHSQALSYTARCVHVPVRVCFSYLPNQILRSLKVCTISYTSYPYLSSISL